MFLALTPRTVSRSFAVAIVIISSITLVPCSRNMFGLRLRQRISRPTFPRMCRLRISAGKRVDPPQQNTPSSEVGFGKSVVTRMNVTNRLLTIRNLTSSAKTELTKDEINMESELKKKLTTHLNWELGLLNLLRLNCTSAINVDETSTGETPYTLSKNVTAANRDNITLSTATKNAILLRQKLTKVPRNSEKMFI